MISGPLIIKMAGMIPNGKFSFGPNRYHNRSEVKLEVNASALPALPEMETYRNCANNADAKPATVYSAGWER